MALSLESRSRRIRRAVPGEAGPLSALVFRSKAHWGYDPAFMDACREALTLTRRYIADAEVWVCEEHGQPLGVAGFQATGEQVDLDLMFVDPAAIGAGVGRALFSRVIARARYRGARLLTIASDLEATGFYLSMGATRIGEVRSESITGRMLPAFEYRIPAS